MPIYLVCVLWNTFNQVLQVSTEYPSLRLFPDTDLGFTSLAAFGNGLLFLMGAHLPESDLVGIMWSEGPGGKWQCALCALCTLCSVLSVQCSVCTVYVLCVQKCVNVHCDQIMFRAKIFCCALSFLGPLFRRKKFNLEKCK